MSVDEHHRLIRFGIYVEMKQINYYVIDSSERCEHAYIHKYGNLLCAHTELHINEHVIT